MIHVATLVDVASFVPRHGTQHRVAAFLFDCLGHLPHDGVTFFSLGSLPHGQLDRVALLAFCGFDHVAHSVVAAVANLRFPDGPLHGVALFANARFNHGTGHRISPLAVLGFPNGNSARYLHLLADGLFHQTIGGHLPLFVDSLALDVIGRLDTVCALSHGILFAGSAHNSRQYGARQPTA